MYNGSHCLGVCMCEPVRRYQSLNKNAHTSKKRLRLGPSAVSRKASVSKCDAIFSVSFDFLGAAPKPISGSPKRNEKSAGDTRKKGHTIDQESLQEEMTSSTASAHAIGARLDAPSLSRPVPRRPLLLCLLFVLLGILGRTPTWHGPVHKSRERVRVGKDHATLYERGKSPVGGIKGLRDFGNLRCRILRFSRPQSQSGENRLF